jgi:probable F420-dependent oxidoreductase
MTSTSATSSSLVDRLGRIGVWSVELRYGDPGAADEAVSELDELGFGAVWIPGGAGGEIFSDVDRLLAATRNAVICTGIINIWKHEPSELGAWWRGLSAERQSRVMLGLGISHAQLIGADYSRPIATMTAYLDGLDAETVAPGHRCLAALGPKMLDLAKARSAGAHPYLVTPEHTAFARERMGPGALLAPEQGVIFETDPAKAREIARQALGVYMQLPNYVNNWRRLGFTEDDVTGPSDRLCDALFAWGGIDRIVSRVNQHLEAGANHVCIQVVHGAPGAAAADDFASSRQAWRELAKALL